MVGILINFHPRQSDITFGWLETMKVLNSPRLQKKENGKLTAFRPVIDFHGVLVHFQFLAGCPDDFSFWCLLPDSLQTSTKDRILCVSSQGIHQDKKYDSSCGTCARHPVYNLGKWRGMRFQNQTNWWIACWLTENYNLLRASDRELSLNLVFLQTYQRFHEIFSQANRRNLWKWEILEVIGSPQATGSTRRKFTRLKLKLNERWIQPWALLFHSQSSSVWRWWTIGSQRCNLWWTKTLDGWIPVSCGVPVT